MSFPRMVQMTFNNSVVELLHTGLVAPLYLSCIFLHLGQPQKCQEDAGLDPSATGVSQPSLPMSDVVSCCQLEIGAAAAKNNI